MCFSLYANAFTGQKHTTKTTSECEVTDKEKFMFHQENKQATKQLPSEW